MANLETVYHYTDTVHLPFILRDGALRPGRGTVGPFPRHDFLWATADPRGSQTATLLSSRDAYRRGAIWLVRFVLPAASFRPWPEQATENTGWSLIARHTLEATARDLSELPKNWHTRIDPLPIDAATLIEYRSYGAPGWRPVTDRRVREHGPDDLEFTLGGSAFRSERVIVGPNLPVAYRARRRPA